MRPMSCVSCARVTAAQFSAWSCGTRRAQLVALLTMALLTMALLTMAILTMAILTRACSTRRAQLVALRTLHMCASTSENSPKSTAWLRLLPSQNAQSSAKADSRIPLTASGGRRACHRMGGRLQPTVWEGGCNRSGGRLQPYGREAATVCGAGCERMH